MTGRREWRRSDQKAGNYRLEQLKGRCKKENRNSYLFAINLEVLSRGGDKSGAGSSILKRKREKYQQTTNGVCRKKRKEVYGD